MFQEHGRSVRSSKTLTGFPKVYFGMRITFSKTTRMTGHDLLGVSCTCQYACPGWFSLIHIRVVLINNNKYNKDDNVLNIVFS